jgi:hypothetical protein
VVNGFIKHVLGTTSSLGDNLVKLLPCLLDAGNLFEQGTSWCLLVVEGQSVHRLLVWDDEGSGSDCQWKEGKGSHDEISLKEFVPVKYRSVRWSL